MIKRLLFILMIPLMLAGCQDRSPDPYKGHAIIDWVDFVKLNGKTYLRLYDKAVSGPNVVTGQVIGKVEFKVADVVTNPDYRTKDGDASFLKKGTPLYRVNGYEPDVLLAAKDGSRIGGYRLYSVDNPNSSLRERSVVPPPEQTNRIELYRLDQTTPFRTLTGEDKDRFLAMVAGGQVQPGNERPRSERDPDYYSWVTYGEGPFASIFSMFDDGSHVTAVLDDERVLDPEIRQYLSR